jgi:N-acyl-D-aspartate/D-glutamate deacylase
VDIAAQVPHGAVRAYVMGENSVTGEPTAAEIAAMADIVEEGLRAGALGFSTSRTVLHKSVDGELVPGTTATEPELVGIGGGIARAGHGVFEHTSDMVPAWDEFGWMTRLSRDHGVPIVFSMLQSPVKQMSWTDQMAGMRAANDDGAAITAAIGLRGIGVVMAWQGTVHPFMQRPSWMAIADLPWEAQYARLSDPAFKAQLLAEDSVPPDSPDMAAFFMLVTAAWAMQFPLTDDFNYEPTRAQSVFGFADAAGQDPAAYAYDWLMADGGGGMIYLPVINYMDGNLDFVKGLLEADDTVVSLSDGGAHCGTICDAAAPTFLLSYWARDRTAGTIPLELAVKRQTRDGALLYGMADRGLLAPGLLADVNVIDMDRLRLEKPWLAFDLPAGGKRLLQKAVGYAATVKSGVVTFRDGVGQGVYPGTVVRGPQMMAMAEAAE